MKYFNSVLLISDPKSRSCLFCSLLLTLSLICGFYFIGNAWVRKDLLRLPSGFGQNTTLKHTVSDKCERNCKPIGTEALPKGIISMYSNLEMRPLWGPLTEDNNSKQARSLLAIAVGINQKGLVNGMVKKFLADDFVVMLFHYDGVVDEWRDLEWSARVIHVSAKNQTKWWFAKRFLHPDIVAEYDYVFLWDEDLTVENFHPRRYVSIVKEEGLEISQPGLDADKSEVHHPITIRKRRGRSRVHRRFYKVKGKGGRCDKNSTSPPCVGWVEMMAPVFSRAAWRCAWYMIQNELIHAWGLDMKLGYCGQGDRAVKVGVVDEEYIVHLALPTLGGFFDKNKVRQQSHNEMIIFKDRWNKAINQDQCWIDPFPL